MINCHQLRRPQWRSLRLGRVVHVVLSCLEGHSGGAWRMHQRALMWRRLSPRRRLSSTRRRQSSSRSSHYDTQVMLVLR